MSPIYVDAAALERAVPWTGVIDALETTFAAPSLPDAPQRSVLERDGAQMLLMPAWGSEAAGVKLVTVQPDNPKRGAPLINGVYVLFSGDTLEPIALFDAAALTAIRTASVSALATKHLAAQDADRLVVFGSGVQAEAHVHALAAIRPLDVVIVVPRSEPSGLDLVERLSGVGFEARLGTADAVAEADLVCTCTTSREPVFPGSALRAGAHVNAIGTHTATAREVDSEVVARAFTVVETREVAAAEAGDLLIPLAEGAVEAARVPAAELAEVVRGRRPGVGEGDITLFKSVGVGFEDLAVARFAYDQIRAEKAQND